MSTTKRAVKTSAILEYTAAYSEGEDGWVIAEVLDYPGVVSQGRTLKSAQRMIRDALKLMAECHIEDGKPLPRPNPRARSKNAVFVETIPLRIRVMPGVKS
ncbi:MAG: type II toxin-antitoxin system HicB family antitoxin [Planctomycetaceae bacterium]